MAWTDQCKIQAVETIKKVAADKGIAVKKAIAEVSKESDIPQGTLKEWYWPQKGPKTRTKKTTEKGGHSEIQEMIEKQKKAGRLLEKLSKWTELEGNVESVDGLKEFLELWTALENIERKAMVIRQHLRNVHPELASNTQ